MAAVCHSTPIALIYRIIQTEHISPDKGVISLENNSDLSKVALVKDHFMNIFKRFFSLFIDDNFDFVSGYRMIWQIAWNMFTCAVSEASST